MIDRWLENPQGLRGPHYRIRLPQVSLEILRGGAQRRSRMVYPPVFLIGSADDCDLVLGDRLFPAVHTYLYVTGAGVSVRHIGEGSALCLNGFTIESAQVQDGDRLRMGPYEFLVHVSPAPTGSDETDGAWHDSSSLETSDDEWDSAWAEAQMLLCDLPAPLRPLAAELPSVWRWQRRAAG